MDVRAGPQYRDTGPGFTLEEFVCGLTDLIRIERVRLVDGNSFESEPASPSVDPAGSIEGDPSPEMSPPIGFFPDGSSDSAEIILASRSEEDHRRIAVQLQG